MNEFEAPVKYLDASRRAPYLEISSAECLPRNHSINNSHSSTDRKRNGHGEQKDEADAAAGGSNASTGSSTLGKVTSFSFLSRTASMQFLAGETGSGTNGSGNSTRNSNSGNNGNNSGSSANLSGSGTATNSTDGRDVNRNRKGSSSIGSDSGLGIGAGGGRGDEGLGYSYARGESSDGINDRSHPGRPQHSASAQSARPRPNHNDHTSTVEPSWRQQDRIKTAGVGLVLALMVGTDPPDIIKPDPCATLQTWMDPTGMNASRAMEKIGSRLESQYMRWHHKNSRLKFRKTINPTVDDVKGLCLWLRKQAKQERVLLHYNGHGVPRPTRDGEIWVFDQKKTEYVPLPVYQLRRWLGKPNILILDCSSAGVLMPHLTQPLDGGRAGADSIGGPRGGPGMMMSHLGSPSNGGLGAANASAPGGNPHFGGMSLSSQETLGKSNMTAASHLQSQASSASSLRSSNGAPPKSAQPRMDMGTAASVWVKDTIILCPTSEHENLPVQPEYPADIFTSCLTTPIKMALRWFVRNNPYSMGDLDPETVDFVPGNAKDRSTPLGELNWIFIGITDAIAWNVLPTPLFQRLFRQDLVVASMFRNFLLADRILRSLNCTPQSYPPLPPGIADHPLWMSWDLACETCLFTLVKKGIIGNHLLKNPNAEESGDQHAEFGSQPDSTADGKSRRQQPQQAKQQQLARSEPQNEIPQDISTNISSPFFEEQLTAFETWLNFASIQRTSMDRLDDDGPPMESPEQLPVLLQILLSPVHRVRALALFKEFLDLGPWAVNLSLRLGIVFPYVLKLLTSQNYTGILVGIWASILKFDPSCRSNLMQENALRHFVQAIASWSKAPTSNSASLGLDYVGGKQRTMAAFNLATSCYKCPPAQMDCFRQGLHTHCCALLSSQDFSVTDSDMDEDDDEKAPPSLRLWLCLCLGHLVLENPTSQRECIRANVHRCLLSKIQDRDPRVRAAVCYALSCFLGGVAPGTVPGSFPSTKAPGTSPSTVPSPPPQMGSPMHPSSSRTAAPFMSNPNSMLSAQMPTATMTMPGGLAGSSLLPGHMPQGMGAALGQHGQPLRSGRPGSTLAATLGASSSSQSQLSSSMRIHQSRGNPSSGSMMPQMAAGQGGMGLGIPGANQMRRHGSRMNPQQPGAGMMQGRGGTTSVMPSIGLMGGSPQILPGGLINQTRRPVSIYENSSRLEVDLNIMKSLTEVSRDGSVLVRYEAIMAMARMVQKYLQAFLVVADEMTPRASKDSKKRAGLASKKSNKEPKSTGQSSSSSSPSSKISVPEGLNRSMLKKFTKGWEVLRTVQHFDTHLKVSNAAMTIVKLVNEELLDMRTLAAAAEAEATAATLAAKKEDESPKQLGGIVEEGSSAFPNATNAVVAAAAAADTSMDRVESDQVLFRPPDNNASRDKPMLRRNQVSGFLNSTQPEQPPRVGQLRRISSEQGGWQSAASANAGAGGRNHAFQNQQPRPTPMAKKPGETMPNDIPFLKSQFYKWQREIFETTYNTTAEKNERLNDPLCPVGATRDYQRRRNRRAFLSSHRLAQRYAELVPSMSTLSPLTSITSRRTNTMLHENQMEERITTLRGELMMKETKKMHTAGTKMTSILRFHSYEDVLMVCDKQSTVSAWNYETGTNLMTFQNGNRKNTRMTTAGWINEESSSLFFVGCDDGSVRVWDELIKGKGDICEESPKLATAFLAVPGMKSDQTGGSGLVCEWQQRTGVLAASGNTDTIRCWDLAGERCIKTLRTETDAVVTSLTTTWDAVQSVMPGGYHGMSPDTLLAGFSDGTLRIFDIREKDEAVSQFGRKSRRHTRFTEHRNWILDAYFTNYAGRFEVVTGCMGSVMKAWDLRMSNSVRTVKVQNTSMTAMAVHRQIPIAAAGSQGNTIKLLTLDGKALTRYHDRSGQRSDFISCLEFHRHKLVLASGSTNSVVSVYQPRAPVVFNPSH